MIEPLQDNLVIEPIKESSETPGGIILPDRAQNIPKFGTVQFVGPGVVALKPGDVIMLPSWDDDKLEVDGKEYIVLAEKSISVRISG